MKHFTTLFLVFALFSGTFINGQTEDEEIEFKDGTSMEFRLLEDNPEKELKYVLSVGYDMNKSMGNAVPFEGALSANGWYNIDKKYSFAGNLSIGFPNERTSETFLNNISVTEYSNIFEWVKSEKSRIRLKEDYIPWFITNYYAVLPRKFKRNLAVNFGINYLHDPTSLILNLPDVLDSIYIVQDPTYFNLKAGLSFWFSSYSAFRVDGDDRDFATKARAFFNFTYAVSSNASGFIESRTGNRIAELSNIEDYIEFSKLGWSVGFEMLLDQNRYSYAVELRQLPTFRQVGGEGNFRNLYLFASLRFPINLFIDDAQVF